MANAYLSEKILKNNPREYHDHEEFEQLLESFSKYVEEIVHEGTSTLTNIKSTEEIIDLILDSNRNTLLALDLKVSIGTMGLGLGALTAGTHTRHTSPLTTSVLFGGRRLEQQRTDVFSLSRTQNHFYKDYLG